MQRHKKAQNFYDVGFVKRIEKKQQEEEQNSHNMKYKTMQF